MVRTTQMSCAASLKLGGRRWDAGWLLRGIRRQRLWEGEDHLSVA
jgi:hypothetical protein